MVNLVFGDNLVLLENKNKYKLFIFINTHGFISLIFLFSFLLYYIL